MKQRKKDATEVSAPPRKRRNTFLPLAIGTTGGVALASAAFWFFQRQADLVVEGRADRYDLALLDLIRSSQSERLDRAMTLATQLGSHAAIGTFAGLTALTMIRRHRRHDAWTVVISTGGAMVLNTFLKALFQRQRPQTFRYIRLPRSHSFPSGHSLLSAATYPIVAHHLVETAGYRTQIAAHVIAFGTVASVGYSRVYFGVHFPSDVLAGFAAGLGWLGLTSLSHTALDQELGVIQRARAARRKE